VCRCEARQALLQTLGIMIIKARAKPIWLQASMGVLGLPLATLGAPSSSSSAAATFLLQVTPLLPCQHSSVPHTHHPLPPMALFNTTVSTSSHSAQHSLQLTSQSGTAPGTPLVGYSTGLSTDLYTESKHKHQLLPHVLLLLCATGQQGNSEGRPPWDVAKRLLAWMFNGAE
jgi:hypothetical protein